jgi:hypothetical protein
MSSSSGARAMPEQATVSAFNSWGIGSDGHQTMILTG